jgi:hypothetical protein
MMMFDVNEAGAPIPMQEKQALMHKGGEIPLLLFVTT